MYSLFFSIISFVAGYSVATSKDEEVRIFVDSWINKTKKLSVDIKQILIITLDNIEGIESDEIKANAIRIFNIIKDRFDELSEQETLGDKIDYTKKMLLKDDKNLQSKFKNINPLDNKSIKELSSKIPKIKQVPTTRKKNKDVE